ncbi:hypothetical protein ACH5RR_033687 [Cinchona calisaya]|uniref:Uncharacterized protein n=1 Tax=Cinchona calisaya TaxID=153742 RepID=A0ABD2YAY1_9GENT
MRKTLAEKPNNNPIRRLTKARIKAEKQVIGGATSNQDTLLDNTQDGQNLVAADQNITKTTTRDQPVNLESSNSNYPLKTQVVKILQDIVETGSKEDKTSNSKEKSATIEEHVTNLYLHNGKAILLEDETVGIATNEDVHSTHMNSLDVTKGHEAKSKDELDLVTNKFMLQL